MSLQQTLSLWACPHCAKPLALVGNTWSCDHNHQFDRAKEGYVNLLPANFKRSKIPGDGPDMIAARRRIHDAALYEPLADALTDTLSAMLTSSLPDTRSPNPSSIPSSPLARPDDIKSLLDLGCGEGYYDTKFTDKLPGLNLLGIDIAKSAVRMAAKRSQHQGNRHQYAVASSNQLPVQSDSVDYVIRIFAPSNDAEVLRVLKPGGYYIEVGPAPQHLWELREALYDTPHPHQGLREELAGSTLAASGEYSYTRNLNNELLNDLLKATPFAYRGHREKRAALRQRESMSLGMAFQWRVFCKPTLR